MSRSQHSADEIRDELERVAASLSANDEDLDLDFRRPFLAGPHWPFAHNWDVRVAVPDGLEDLAFRVIDEVATRWNLEEK
ncbi:hypothetical protein [Sphingomonas sp. NFR04]|uniref:hypothetical protein n=1 Tax=Sphingomonas sp. NFR04 TaxID=1566283 RepID=UPI000B82E82A|nr:hypothetical protein [Sphingomonas sp. NFR04]